MLTYECMGTFLRSLRALERESRHAYAAQDRREKQALRDAERAKRAEERNRAWDNKEKTRLYLESRTEETKTKNEDLNQEISRLKNLLLDSLSQPSSFDLNSLLKKTAIPQFDAGKLAIPEKEPQKYIPHKSFLDNFIPGSEKRYQKKTIEAEEKFRKDYEEYKIRESVRIEMFNESKKTYEEKVQKIEEENASHDLEINTLQMGFTKGIPDKIITYYSLAFESAKHHEDFPLKIKFAYVPESKQLVVEYDLPSFDIIPETTSHKYIKATDKIISVPATTTFRKSLYTSVIAQETLRLLNLLFNLDQHKHIDNIVLNEYVETVNPATGKTIRPCIITIRTSYDTFFNLDLRKVDPVACLKELNASVSRSPSDLAPVKPILEFNMVDPRFIQETDVLSGLDQRPNLMDLTPGEFESLITNLFEKMGLETRLTQASRDGGVDCVAYDTRPIFGGKVVIQAKRYKNTVGVSAVRDLFGTVQNEGASKGILVTTSGYGKAAFDFAEGKPLELLSGTNLLYLLKTYAEIKATIKVPDDWKDPEPDS